MTSAINVCRHPLLQHHLAIVRDKNATCESFRIAARRVTQLILYEATQNVPQSKATIETPLASMEVDVLSADTSIIISPILRAGLAMSEVLIDMIPTASVYHIGLYRDEATLQPVSYFNKINHEMNLAKAHIFVLDPMLATGGSVSAALKIFKDCGANETNMTLVSLIAAPEGIKVVNEIFPKVKIFVGAIDSRLNEKAYIVPGLGDAGDRTFGTALK